MNSSNVVEYFLFTVQYTHRGYKLKVKEQRLTNHLYHVIYLNPLRIPLV